MNPVPGYTELPGLNAAIEAHRVTIAKEADDTWVSSDPDLALMVQSTYDPLPYCRVVKMGEAAAARWATMTGGHTTAAGISLDTSLPSISLLHGLYSIAATGNNGPFNFKGRDSSWHTLGAAEAVALWLDLTAFVQSAFNREKAILDQINAASTWQDVWAIDAGAGFPANV
jgi:hypothetical protein